MVPHSLSALVFKLPKHRIARMGCSACLRRGRGHIPVVGRLIGPALVGTLDFNPPQPRLQALKVSLARQ